MGAWMVREKKTKILLGVFVEDTIARLGEAVSSCSVYRSPLDDVEPDDADPRDFEYCRINSGGFVNYVFAEEDNPPRLWVDNVMGYTGKFGLYPTGDVIDDPWEPRWKSFPDRAR